MKYLLIRKYKGRETLYWYPKKRYLIDGEWKDCPFKPVKVKTAAHAERLNDALDKWREGLSGGNRSFGEGTVGWIIAQYKKDERFKNLRGTTQKLYFYHFPEIERVFGDAPAGEVTRQDARAFYHTFAGTKRKASMMAQIARVIFAFGKDIGAVADNPFESLRIAKAKAREAVWTPAMLQKAKEAATALKMPSIALALQMGMDTGQRPGDLRLLTWNRYQFNAAFQKWTVKLRQTKTGVWVEVPIMAELKAMMDEADKASPVMLICEATGKPYTKDMLCRRIRDVMTQAEIGKEMQFRDLRRTAVVRLAEHGCDLPEICAITGHSLSDATSILEVYLPRNSKMAANAIAKLEKVEKS